MGGTCGSEVRDRGSGDQGDRPKSLLRSYKMEILIITLSFSEDFVQVK